MSRPNYSAVRLALLHHLDLSEGQRPPLPPPPPPLVSKSAACYLEPLHWHLYWWYRTGRREHSQISKDVLNCPSYQINLLCGAFVEDGPASASWSLAGLWFMAAGCKILNCPHVILVSWRIWSHSCKKRMEAKGWITLFTNHPQSSGACHHLRWCDAVLWLFKFNIFSAWK